MTSLPQKGPQLTAQLLTWHQSGEKGHYVERLWTRKGFANCGAPLQWVGREEQWSLQTVLFFRGYAGVRISLKHFVKFIGEKTYIFTILELMPYKLLKTKSYVNIATLVLCVGYTVLLCVIIILIAVPSLLAAFWHHFLFLNGLWTALSCC